MPRTGESVPSAGIWVPIGLPWEPACVNTRYGGLWLITAREITGHQGRAGIETTARDWTVA